MQLKSIKKVQLYKNREFGILKAIFRGYIT